MTRPTCTRCRATNRDRARFCNNCGMELHPPIGRAAQFLLEDEIKYVTVLFGDIVDSTALVADVSPDEAQFRLTPAVTLMSEAILEFGGTINQILGDGVLAFFGAPTSQEDHALRACCA